MEQTRRGLSGNAIKLIAIAAMTIDHLTWTLWPGYDRHWWVLLFHVIGRLTAPIMWFFVAEGFAHTHSVKRYGARLFVLAFVSHFAYNFCFGNPMVPFRTGILNQTSVAWSLAFGLVLLWVNKCENLKEWHKFLLVILVCVITLPSDWSCVAAMAIFFIGANHGNFRRQMLWLAVWSIPYAIVYYFCIDKVYALVQLCTCLSIPLLRLYNGERGKWKGMSKLFYVYYPAHLALIGVLRLLLWGGLNTWSGT